MKIISVRQVERMVRDARAEAEQNGNRIKNFAERLAKPRSASPFWSDFLSVANTDDECLSEDQIDFKKLVFRQCLILNRCHDEICKLISCGGELTRLEAISIVLGKVDEIDAVCTQPYDRKDGNADIRRIFKLRDRDVMFSIEDFELAYAKDPRALPTWNSSESVNIQGVL